VYNRSNFSQFRWRPEVGQIQEMRTLKQAGCGLSKYEIARISRELFKFLGCCFALTSSSASTHRHSALRIRRYRVEIQRREVARAPFLHGQGCHRGVIRTELDRWNK